MFLFFRIPPLFCQTGAIHVDVFFKPEPGSQFDLSTVNPFIEKICRSASKDDGIFTGGGVVPDIAYGAEGQFLQQFIPFVVQDGYGGFIEPDYQRLIFRDRFQPDPRQFRLKVQKIIL